MAAGFLGPERLSFEDNRAESHGSGETKGSIEHGGSIKF